MCDQTDKESESIKGQLDTSKWKQKVRAGFEILIITIFIY